MTGSPTLADGRLFVPVSSAEEAIATDPTYACCKFRGAVAAVDAATGKLLWKAYVTPAPPHPFKLNTRGRADVRTCQAARSGRRRRWIAAATWSTWPPATPIPTWTFPTPMR